MRDRVRQVVGALLEQGEPMMVRDHDGEMFVLSMTDVQDIMTACQCGQDEALERLTDWVMERVQ